MIALSPRAAAVVLAAAHANVLRALGDVPGHEFHGNQWTAGHGEAWNEKQRPRYERGGGNFKSVADVHEQIARDAVVAPLGKDTTLPHYTNGNEFRISTVEQRLIPNSGSLGKGGTVFGDKRFDVTLKADTKVLDLTPKLWHDFYQLRPEGKGERPVDTGKRVFDYAKQHGVDVVKISGKIHGLGTEYAVLNMSAVKKQIRTAAAKRANHVHAAADKHYKPMLLAATYAVQSGRKAAKAGADPSAIGKAVRVAALKAFPKALLGCLVEAGTQTLGKLRAAGDAPGHAFHGNQWTQALQDVDESRDDDGFIATSTFMGHSNSNFGPEVDAKVERGEGAIRDVRITDLHTEQDKVGADKVKGIIRKGSDESRSELPRVARDANGKLVLTDGNHRVAAEYFKGNDTIKAVVVGVKGTARGLQMRALAPQRPGQPHSSSGPFNLQFNAEDPAAVAWAEEHAAELADGLSETTTEAVREAIARGLEGEGVAAAKELILDAIGDEDRAELIARTETMIAANEGQRQGWNQAIGAGLLPNDAQVEWIAASDCCDDCDELDGTTRPINGEYDDADAGDGPPLHPNCRCTEGISA